MRCNTADASCTLRLAPNESRINTFILAAAFPLEGLLYVRGCGAMGTATFSFFERHHTAPRRIYGLGAALCVLRAECTSLQVADAEPRRLGPRWLRLGTALRPHADDAS